MFFLFLFFFAFVTALKYLNKDTLTYINLYNCESVSQLSKYKHKRPESFKVVITHYVTSTSIIHVVKYIYEYIMKNNQHG